ncbi:hypothetical protein [Streptomyces sp. NPDC055299]
MPRTDLYRNVHMGQRARLFTLAVELGAADLSQGAPPPSRRTAASP